MRGAGAVMSRRRSAWTWLTGVALLLVATAASAQTWTIRVRPVWASGEIARVDATSTRRALVVRQGAHVMTFTLGPQTRFVHRREPVNVRDVRDLRAHVGDRVKISYTIVSGSRVALRVVITEPAETSR